MKWTKTRHGYLVRNDKGRMIYQHREVAEKVLGRALKGGELIHHVDGDKTNNAHSNLVICPSDSYHRLLHQREDALLACGNVDWLKCCYCMEYDAPENLRIYDTSPPRHGECNKAYFKKWAESKKRDKKLL